MDTSFRISAGDYEIREAEREIGHKEVISFTSTPCTGCGPPGGTGNITFFICDEANFGIWLDWFNTSNDPSELTAVLHSKQSNVESWSGEFEFPYKDSWYFVWCNKFDKIYAKNVVARMDLWELAELPLLYIELAIVGIIIIAVLVGFGAMWFKRRREVEVR